MFELETKRLILRDVQVTDFQSLHDLRTNPEVTHFLDYIKSESEKETRDWIHGTMYHNSLLPRQSYNLAIVLQTKNEVIGWIGIGQADEKEYGDLDFGYGLLPEHWGKGYATEALVAIIGLAFDEYTEAEKICGECDVENHASARVMEKAGLEHVKTDDDDMIFAITRINWARDET